MVREIVLMFGLGGAVVRFRRDLGHDGIGEKRLITQALHIGAHGGELGCVMGVDARAVLRADIVALPVQSGGVVHGEKYLEHRVQTQHIGVEIQPDHFGMAGLPRADLTVTGAQRRAIAVAALHAQHTAQRAVGGVEAPETA